MRIETKEDFERARERLRRRDSDSLAALLMSLAMNTGPVGEQVRTFIVGDDLAETVESVRKSIRGLTISSEYEHRHALGRETGVSLDFIVDSVERLVLPTVPRNSAVVDHCSHLTVPNLPPRRGHSRLTIVSKAETKCRD